MDFPTIFLLGYMGSGKSYTGRQLAQRLSTPFVDLDAMVAAKASRSIRQLVADEGLPAFRRLEADSLRLIAPRNTVVACGGGTPLFHDNLDWMNARGITCYLDTPPAVLAARLAPERQQRPLLADLTEETLLPFITDHLREREPTYRRAHLRYLQTTGREPIADDIRAYLLRIAGH